MTEITMKITNLDKVQIGIRSVGAAIPEATRHDVKAAMDSARETYYGTYAGGYSVAPPERSAYERTGNLGRSMWVEERGSSVTIVSRATYSPFVIGDAEGQGQAYVHVGRWPLLAVLVRKWADTLLATVDATLSRLIRAAGLGGGEAGGM